MKVGGHDPLKIQQQLKANQFEGYQKSLEHDAAQNPDRQLGQSRIRWNITRSKEKGVKVNPFMETDHVTISSIRRIDQTIKSSVVAHKLGYAINLEDKLDVLKDKYIKNFLQSKSHNFIVSKFAQLKTAFLQQTLANLGVTIPELQKMQKKALKEAQDENELLFEENEYNEEMIHIIGGSPKKIRKEVKIMGEIRTQLTTQMDKLGRPGHYSEARMLDIKLRVCRKIQEEFQRERDVLAYERDYFFINKDQVKTREKSIFDPIVS